MLLNDTYIWYLSLDKNMIEPFNKNDLQAGSYDLHLDSTILVPKNKGIVKKSQEEEYTKIDKNGFVLQPGQLVLGSTKEWVNIPDNITGIVKGVSSVGRLGLIIEAAGVIDAGFRGNITLELMNNSGRPIELTEFDRIGQILFLQMIEPAKNPYRGKYQDQDGVTGSRLHEEQKEIFKELVQEGTLIFNPSHFKASLED